MKKRFKFLGWIVIAVMFLPLWILIWGFTGFDISEYIYKKCKDQLNK